MLANTFAMLTVALVAGSAACVDLLYKSVSYKGSEPESQLLNTMKFTIPDGQCSGAIGKSLLCPKTPIVALEVTAVDGEPYPLIHIDQRLGYAEVQRAPDAQGLCGGTSEVVVRTDCLVARSRRDLASFDLPPL